MCTTVVGGSIHRAATSISAASNQISATPITTHRTNARSNRFQSDVLVSVFGPVVTFQNNRLARVAADGRSLRDGVKGQVFVAGAACPYSLPHPIHKFFEVNLRGASRVTFLTIHKLWNSGSRLIPDNCPLHFK
jgi:hypothetical protein